MKIKTERQETCKVGFLRRTIGFLGLKIEVFSVFLQSFEFCKFCQKIKKYHIFQLAVLLSGTQVFICQKWTLFYQISIYNVASVQILET